MLPDTQCNVCLNMYADKGHGCPKCNAAHDQCSKTGLGGFVGKRKGVVTLDTIEDGSQNR